MPFVPLKQEVTIIKMSNDNGWGEPIEQGRKTYKARVQETERTREAAGGENSVYTVNAQGSGDTVKIYLDGLVDVTLDDRVSYKDELEREFIYEPIKIEVKRWLGGKPLFTIVYA